MDETRDIWRIKWLLGMGKRKSGYINEGVWISPVRLTAPMAAREAAIQMVRSCGRPGGAEYYPLAGEVLVYAMDSGRAVEVYRISVTCPKEGDSFYWPGGLAVDHMVPPLGHALDTGNNWTETYRP